MLNDIVFFSDYFYLELPTYSAGSPTRIEAQTEYFAVRLALPERISIG